jgi:hypothetical protein
MESGPVSAGLTCEVELPSTTQTIDFGPEPRVQPGLFSGLFPLCWWHICPFPLDEDLRPDNIPVLHIANG